MNSQSAGNEGRDQAELSAAGAAFAKTYPNDYPAGKGRWYDPFSARGRAI